jgi:hypothetical protein
MVRDLFRKEPLDHSSERMKTGINHQIPRTNETLAIFEAIKPISGNSPYISPADIRIHTLIKPEIGR